MTAEEFVSVLADHTPSIDALLALGMSESGATRLREGHLASRRVSADETAPSENELLRLLHGWDVSKLQVGMVWFRGQPLYDAGAGWVVGSVEIDPLVLREATGSVDVRDFYNSSHVMWDAAESGESFLAALAHAQAFFSRCVLGEVSHDDNAIARSIAQECSTLAGGPRYLEFYLMLCGGEA
jgi:hypothetical protein